MLNNRLLFPENNLEDKMKIQFVKSQEIKLVGIEKRINLIGNEIQELWTEFTKRNGEIKNKIFENCYGVASEMVQGENGPIFTEMVASEVSEFKDIPAGMSQKTIPPHEYIVFTHSGKLLSENGESLVKKSYEYIYGEFLPKSSYSIAGNFNFELYDERFIFDNPNSEFDIYIPVLEKK